MSPNDLLRAVRLQPFEPFRLYLTDGTTHDVTHPDMMIVGVRTSHIAIPAADAPDFADYTVKVDNLHITKMTPLGSEAPAR